MLAFDHFRLDPETDQWWRGKDLVRLSPKAGAVLHYLVTHAGQLVSTTDIRQAVWVDRGGSAAALKVCIGEIRKGLQDDPRTPRFIETHPRQGYRFIAPLISSAPAALSPGAAVGDPLGATLAWPPPLSLVGRDPELGQLQRTFSQALQGERQFVFVSGEPGIGKTTLLNAFLSQLAAQSETVWVARGQCVEQYGAGEAYLPLLEALGRLGREAEGAEITPVLAQYAPMWLAQLPALVMPAEREALQRTLVGATQERMLREMAEALEVLTTRQPVVLVLEDLHWSDQSTLELLGYILRRQGSARLFLLGTFRSTEVLGNDQSLRRIVQDMHGRGSGEEMQLGLLDKEQVHAYLRTRLGRAEAAELSFPELAQWVHRQTEGNPLFMVTLVEQLQREGVLTETEGAWQIGEDWDQLVKQVPESLRQVIDQQFESLSVTEQQVLAVASVVGTEFAAAAVAAGGEQAIEQVEEQCGELANKGHFIREAGIEEWPDGILGGQYNFLHALYQNVLYGRVPEARRVQMHRRVAERKAAAYGERLGEVAAELAMHFERGQLYAKAAEYHRQAGKNVQIRGAYPAAAEHFRVGMALLEQLPETPTRDFHELRLAIALGQALQAAKGLGSPDVKYAYERAWELSQRVEEVPEQDSLLTGLSGYYIDRSNLDRVIQLAGQLLERGQRLAQPPLQLEAHLHLSMARYWGGELLVAWQHLEQALHLCETAGQQGVDYLGQDRGMIIHTWAAFVRWHMGYPEHASMHIQQAYALGESVTSPYNFAIGLMLACWFYQLRREPHLAVEQGEAALRTAQEHGLVQIEGFAKMHLQLALLGLHDARGDFPTLMKQLAALGKNESHSTAPGVLALLIQRCLEAGQDSFAESMLRVADFEVEQWGNHFFDAELARLKGEWILIQIQAGKQDAGSEQKQYTSQEAEECFQHGRAIAQQQQAKALELRAAISLGKLWASQGKKRQAREMLAEVYGWFTEGFDTQDLQEAEALLTSLGSRVKRKSRPAPPSPVSPAQIELPQSPLPRENQTTTASSQSAPHLFRQEDEYWTLAFDGHVCRVKATQGMQYLAELLRSPHHEFFSAALASGAAAGSEPTPGGAGLATELGVQLGLSDAGDVLDAQAQAAYKQRLAELRADLEEAQAFNDSGRVEKLQSELEFLTQELAQAVGLGGRSRKAASSTERARVNVTRAIRTAIARIEASHPPLGQYLRRTIKTGTACSYAPDSSPMISWQF